jgi:hypothetical protein
MIPGVCDGTQFLSASSFMGRDLSCCTVVPLGSFRSLPLRYTFLLNSSWAYKLHRYTVFFFAKAIMTF